MIYKLNYKTISIFLLFLTSINYLFFTFRFFQRDNGYILGDWLINYSGGFTRRGLFGELIINISDFLNLDLKSLVYLIVLILYLYLVFLLLKIILKSKINFIIAILIFFLFTFLFTTFDPLATGRKEFLFIIFFCLYLLKNYYYEIIISMLSVITILSLYLLSNPDTVETCKTILSYGYDGIICLSINDLNILKGAGFPIAPFIKDKYYLIYYIRIRITFNYYLLFYTLAKKFRFKFFCLSWSEDDQVSNLNLINHVQEWLGVLVKYAFSREKFLEGSEKRMVYPSKTIFTTLNI